MHKNAIKIVWGVENCVSFTKNMALFWGIKFCIFLCTFLDKLSASLRFKNSSKFPRSSTRNFIFFLVPHKESKTKENAMRIHDYLGLRRSQNTPTLSASLHSSRKLFDLLLLYYCMLDCYI